MTECLAHHQPPLLWMSGYLMTPLAICHQILPYYADLIVAYHISYTESDTYIEFCSKGCQKLPQ